MVKDYLKPNCVCNTRSKPCLFGRLALKPLTFSGLELYLKLHICIPMVHHSVVSKVSPGTLRATYVDVLISAGPKFLSQVTTRTLVRGASAEMDLCCKGIRLVV